MPYIDITAESGGFLFYPGGQLYSDPSSVVALPGMTSGKVGAVAGYSYNYKNAKWLPVSSYLQAPNGTFYVYADPIDVPGKIRRVRIADGSLSDVTTDGGWYLVGTTDSGVYVGKVATPDAGVWWVAFGSTATQVIDHGKWQRYINGGLWTVDRAGNLVRYDVASRAETMWAKGLSFYAYGVVGFDLEGRPIVNNDGSIAIFRPDGSRILIWPNPNGLYATGRVAADSQGVWFAIGSGVLGRPGNGVYLWTPSGGAKLIVASEVHVAGGCLPY
jgi:hypothetical protein